MALRAFKTIDIKDRVLTQLQENVQQFLNQLNKTTLNGLFLEKIKNASGSLIDITIGTSETLVPHGLTREFRGWHIVDIQGDARVWRVASSSADLHLFLPLRASSSVTVKLWVF